MPEHHHSSFEFPNSPQHSRIKLHPGFENSATGVTYIGPLADFPERFLTQAVYCAMMKYGVWGVVHMFQSIISDILGGEDEQQ